MWRSIIIALALICLGLLGWYAVRKIPGRVQADLEVAAQKLIDSQALGDIVVRGSQRDLVLQGTVPTEAAKASAERLLTAMGGVKSVTNQLSVAGGPVVVPPAPGPEPTPEPDTTQAAAPDAGPTPETAEAQADVGPLDSAAPELAPEVVAEVAAAEVAPEVAAPPEVAAVDPGGSLTPAQCKSMIADMTVGDKRITFKSNTGKLTEEGETKVVAIAGLLARCPTAKGVIEGYHDDYGDPDKVKELTQIRAFNVHKRLTDLGMDKSRFRYIGLGYRNMRYRLAKERALNQRIEFNITVE
jgi:outer membrane protein OmpA-like peptidoglycan-associated protein